MRPRFAALDIREISWTARREVNLTTEAHRRAANILREGQKLSMEYHAIVLWAWKSMGDIMMDATESGTSQRLSI